MEREGQDVSGASFGIGAVPNCLYGLINVEVGTTSSSLDYAGLHRSRDVGAGAFTPYVNRSSFAKSDIPAGYVFVVVSQDCVSLYLFKTLLC
jgi:hypothetical protein